MDLADLYFYVTFDISIFPILNHWLVILCSICLEDKTLQLRSVWNKTWNVYLLASPYHKAVFCNAKCSLPYTSTAVWHVIWENQLFWINNPFSPFKEFLIFIFFVYIFITIFQSVPQNVLENSSTYFKWWCVQIQEGKSTLRKN